MFYSDDLKIYFFIRKLLHLNFENLLLFIFFRTFLVVFVDNELKFECLNTLMTCKTSSTFMLIGQLKQKLIPDCFLVYVLVDNELNDSVYL